MILFMQHPTALRTADLYKRLYSRGWRSKYHSSTECSNCLHIDGGDKAAKSSHHPASAFISCDLDRCTEAMNTIEGLCKSQASTIYPKFVESDQDIIVTEPEDAGQNSPAANNARETNKTKEHTHDTSCQNLPATNKAREYTHNTSCQQVMSLIKAARSKRKRKFRYSEDNPNIYNNRDNHELRDDLQHVADANADNIICNPPQSTRHFQEKNSSEEHLEKITTNHHFQNHCLKASTFALSPDKDLRTLAK